MSVQADTPPGKGLIWRNTVPQGLGDSDMPLSSCDIRSTRMDHHTPRPTESSRFVERAPLTRLRASTRSAPTLDVLVGGTRSLLPDGRVWSGLFGNLPVPSAEATALTEISRARRVAPGALVFTRAEVARGLVLVSEGDIALGARANEGGFHTERHMHGPAWLDASAGWLGETHALDARAMTGATVVELPREGLLTVLDRFPALGRRLIIALAREVRALAVNTHDLMHKDAPARLAAWLQEHCAPDVADNRRGLVQLPMRKRDIASQLAITPETLSRLMRQFSSQGVIEVAGYTVHVHDLVALARLARG